MNVSQKERKISRKISTIVKFFEGQQLVFETVIIYRLLVSLQLKIAFQVGRKFGRTSDLGSI